MVDLVDPLWSGCDEGIANTVFECVVAGAHVWIERSSLLPTYWAGTASSPGVGMFAMYFGGPSYLGDIGIVFLRGSLRADSG